MQRLILKGFLVATLGVGLLASAVWAEENPPAPGSAVGKQIGKGKVKRAHKDLSDPTKVLLGGKTKPLRGEAALHEKARQNAKAAGSSTENIGIHSTIVTDPSKKVGGKLTLQAPMAGLKNGMVTMQQALESDSLSASQRINLMKQAAMGVQQLHQAGLLHGDIKADNFLLEDRKPSSSKGPGAANAIGTVVLGDLDKAKEKSKLGKKGTAFHTGNTRNVGAGGVTSEAGEAAGSVGKVGLNILTKGKYEQANVNNPDSAAAFEKGAVAKLKNVPNRLMMSLRSKKTLEREQAFNYKQVDMAVDQLQRESGFSDKTAAELKEAMKGRLAANEPDAGSLDSFIKQLDKIEKDVRKAELDRVAELANRKTPLQDSEMAELTRLSDPKFMDTELKKAAAKSGLVEKLVAEGNSSSPERKLAARQALANLAAEANPDPESRKSAQTKLRSMADVSFGATSTGKEVKKGVEEGNTRKAEEKRVAERQAQLDAERKAAQQQVEAQEAQKAKNVAKAEADSIAAAGAEKDAAKARRDLKNAQDKGAPESALKDLRAKAEAKTAEAETLKREALASNKKFASDIKEKVLRDMETTKAVNKAVVEDEARNESPESKARSQARGARLAEFADNPKDRKNPDKLAPIERVPASDTARKNVTKSESFQGDIEAAKQVRAQQAARQTLVGKVKGLLGNDNTVDAAQKTFDKARAAGLEANAARDAASKKVSAISAETESPEQQKRLEAAKADLAEKRKAASALNEKRADAEKSLKFAERQEAISDPEKARQRKLGKDINNVQETIKTAQSAVAQLESELKGMDPRSKAGIAKTNQLADQNALIEVSKNKLNQMSAELKAAKAGTAVVPEASAATAAKAAPSTTPDAKGKPRVRSEFDETSSVKLKGNVSPEAAEATLKQLKAQQSEGLVDPGEKVKSTLQQIDQEQAAKEDARKRNQQLRAGLNPDTKAVLDQIDIQERDKRSPKQQQAINANLDAQRDAALQEMDRKAQERKAAVDAKPAADTQAAKTTADIEAEAKAKRMEKLRLAKEREALEEATKRAAQNASEAADATSERRAASAKQQKTTQQNAEAQSSRINTLSKPAGTANAASAPDTRPRSNSAPAKIASGAKAPQAPVLKPPSLKPAITAPEPVASTQLRPRVTGSSATPPAVEGGSKRQAIRMKPMTAQSLQADIKAAEAKAAKAKQQSAAAQKIATVGTKKTVSTQLSDSATTLKSTGKAAAAAASTRQKSAAKTLKDFGSNIGGSLKKLVTKPKPPPRT